MDSFHHVYGRDSKRKREERQKGSYVKRREDKMEEDEIKLGEAMKGKIEM